MISREDQQLVKKYSRQFRALAIVGPRQSGKTTLAKTTFTNKPYISLEDPDERIIADSDPRGFLKRFDKNGAIIDEAQRVPSLFNYMQGILDEKKKDGFFILTGSNNFLLQDNISQSLAGRIGYIDLLPFSFREMQTGGIHLKTTTEYIWHGSYPEIFDKKRNPSIWFPSYIRTYVERDVKQLRNIENSIQFNKFLQLCAGRAGQMLNVAALSTEAGVDIKTVNAWLSILQSSFIIYLLPPYHNNFNKRITKTPKLYFYDTGLACSLLGISNTKELSLSHFKGALFENYLITEVQKNIFNKGLSSKLFYWRESNGIEVDLLIEKGNKIIPVEIKSGQTYIPEFSKNLLQFKALTGNKNGTILFDGTQNLTLPNKLKLYNWREFLLG